MKFNNGDIIHGFRVTNLSHIQEVDSDAYLMQHEKSEPDFSISQITMIIRFSLSASARHRIIPRELRISWNTLHSAVPESFLLRNHS